MKRLPLQGIRVLDLSRILAAPLAAQSLGDLGAEVIKVERPGVGDEARRFGPPFPKDANGQDVREAPMYLSANRNKRSITIDLSHPQGQALVRQFVAFSDVLIENYKVGDLKRYGLDYDALHAVNPRLVYCSVTGFGQTGPYATQPGYDTVFQGMGGLMSVTGLPDDVPGGGPMKTGPSLADFMAGQYATAGVLAALYERDTHSGEGAHIDIALLDSTIASQTHYIATYLATHSVPPRRGTEGNGGLPSQAFACADRSIIVICGNEPQYRAFCEVLGHTELATDPRFATNGDRLKHRQALAQTFGDLTAQWQSGELLQRLRAAGVPSGPVNAYPEVFSDPQVQHRQMAMEVQHSRAGPMKLCASPLRFVGMDAVPSMPPPVLGEHTEELLSEVLKLKANEIAQLRDMRVI